MSFVDCWRSFRPNRRFRLGSWSRHGFSMPTIFQPVIRTAIRPARPGSITAHFRVRKPFAMPVRSLNSAVFKWPDRATVAGRGASMGTPAQCAATPNVRIGFVYWFGCPRRLGRGKRPGSYHVLNSSDSSHLDRYKQLLSRQPARCRGPVGICTRASGKHWQRIR